MRSITCAFTVVVLAIGIASTARAVEPPKELAELFPAGTLAYAELHNPAEFATKFATIFKGTSLEDGVAFIHGRKDSAKTMAELMSKREIALLALFTSPEMLAELKKLRIAAGITGFTENGDPDAAVVILTHESPATGLMARAYLTMTPMLRQVGEVSKVPVFQFRTPNVNYDPNGVQVVQNDKKFTDGPHELTLAYTPGLLTIGTSKNAVGHSIKRFVGEEKGDGLAGLAPFKDAVATHRQTGLFYFVQYPEFAAKVGNASRLRGEVRSGDSFLLDANLARVINLFDVWNMTANQKALKTLAGSIRLRDGGLAATMTATFDPAIKSPLLELLAGPGVKLEQLHHAHGPASFAFTVSIAETNRAETILNFLDALAKSQGELGRLPRDVVKEIEDKQKQSIRDGLLAKIEAVTLAMPLKQELPKGGKPAPIVILHTTDSAAATAWQVFAPVLLGDLAGAATTPQPVTETVDGVKVQTVAGTGLRWNAPVHFAAKDKCFAIGLDRKLVAAAVGPDARKSVIGGANAISPPGAGTAVYGVVSLGELVADVFQKPRADGPVAPREEHFVLPNGQPVPESLIEEVKKSRADFLSSLGSMPHAMLSLTRAGSTLQVELYQPKVQNGALKSIIDAAAHWLDKSCSFLGNQRDRMLRGYEGRW